MEPSPAAVNPPASDAAARFAQALEHYRHGRYEAASRVLGAALPLHRYNPPLWNLAGATAKALGQLAGAERYWRHAIALAPGYAEPHYNLGVLLQQGGRTAEAIAAYRQALLHAPRHVQALNNLGGALERQGELEQALHCYEQAVTADPAHARAHHNRGAALGALGRFEQAHQAFHTAIGLVPPQQRAPYYRGLAFMKRFMPGDADLAAMEALARDAAALPPDHRMQLHFALGKAYGDTGERERSFAQLLAGNRAKRALVPYDEAATLAQFERIRATYTPALMAARDGEGQRSGAPVFILGMPRSGSSLVEQILASHPQVHGAGECQDFGRLAGAIADADGRPLLPDGIAALPPAQLRRLGADYDAALRARAPSALRLTDKNPANFLHAGLIHLALPDARIIHTRRDAVDTCLSCFSQLFDGDHPYAYDLAELGRYWRAYDRLMAHWRSLLPPGVMLEVNYEDLVGDLEGQARRLLAHCGLEWDARCLAFHRTQRPVRTASAAQVREPLYQSSVGRSRSYGELLRPLLDALSA